MLFRWIRQWRQRRRLRGRGLFRYWDGRRARYADPALLWRKLLNHPGMDFAVDLPLADQGKEPEATKVQAILCEIFEVEPWDGARQTGLTSWEILDLVRQFDGYLDALKKNTSPSQMPWQLSAYPSSTGPDSPADPTNSSADCSSTPDGSSFGEDTSSSAPSKTP